VRDWLTLLDLIGDGIVRENLDNLRQELEEHPLINFDGEHFELVFDATFTYPLTNHKIPHGLGLKPLDVIQTSATGAGALTWNYLNFTESHLDVSVTGQCRVRAFIGRYSEG
jgi:hypothetical protein